MITHKVNKYKAEQFQLVYAKKSGTFNATLNYGKRKKGESFFVLNEDVSVLNVSTESPQEEVIEVVTSAVEEIQ